MSSRLPQPPKPSSPFASRPPPAASGGLSGLASRFGSKVNGAVLPAVDEVVCFDFAALTPSALEALDIQPPTAALENVLKAIEGDKAFEQRLKDRLDEAWTGYHLRGAMLVYLWRDDVRDCLATRLSAVKKPLTYLRATDPLLTLNVLARARTSLLLATAPLALERPFLERALACDDPRLIALARSSGVTIEKLSDEPEEVEIEDSE
jgi:hypothetical protein